MLFILPQGDEFYQTRCHYNWLLSPLPRIFVGTLCPAQYLPGKSGETAMTPSVVNSIIVSAGSASASGSSSANTLPAFNSSDNFPLLSSACAVVRAIQERDYDTLAAFVHPEEGVTFTPYSTVDRDSDLRFTAAQVRQFSTDQTVYTWGRVRRLGQPDRADSSRIFLHLCVQYRLHPGP